MKKQNRRELISTSLALIFTSGCLRSTVENKTFSLNIVVRNRTAQDFTGEIIIAGPSGQTKFETSQSSWGSNSTNTYSTTYASEYTNDHSIRIYISNYEITKRYQQNFSIENSTTINVMINSFDDVVVQFN